ncbi:MAG: hypothetical protein KAS32_18470 [Candidatus Peribacteraceae bacterium]|nr:hypothetical protein [Candidatus Peribacteraceae bacterium]
MIYDDSGRFLVRAIFWELSTPERRIDIPPLYTLKVGPAHGLPSAYQIYMNSIDEYEAGIKIAGNMKNWRSLSKDGSWFLNGDLRHGHEGLVQWRLDMEARDKSAAKIQLIAKAEEGNVAAMTKLYNMSPKKIDNRLKKKIGKEDTSKVVDLVARMKEK